jgi:formylglycine-generating enzyme required for sulfatase activity
MRNSVKRCIIISSLVMSLPARAESGCKVSEAAVLTGTNEVTIELPDLPTGAEPLVLIRVPAGGFLMGSNDDSSWSWRPRSERPVHAVNIKYDFYLGKHEITQGQWLAVMGRNPSHFSACGNDCPVETVSWNDCQAFITALNALVPGDGFRLPSEAEWEYACRAGTTTRFSFGDSSCPPAGCVACDLSDYAWWCGNEDPPGTKVVGRKLPNKFGLFDMHGNVWEWCQDRWHDSYAGAPTDGSSWEIDGGEARVLRGGAKSRSARRCRSSDRRKGLPTLTNSGVGFRVAGTP